LEIWYFMPHVKPTSCDVHRSPVWSKHPSGGWNGPGRDRREKALTRTRKRSSIGFGGKDTNHCITGMVCLLITHMVSPTDGIRVQKRVRGASNDAGTFDGTARSEGRERTTDRRTNEGSLQCGPGCLLGFVLCMSVEYSNCPGCAACLLRPIPWQHRVMYPHWIV